MKNKTLITSEGCGMKRIRIVYLREDEHGLDEAAEPSTMVKGRRPLPTSPRDPSDRVATCQAREIEAAHVSKEGGKPLRIAFPDRQPTLRNQPDRATTNPLIRQFVKCDELLRPGPKIIVGPSHTHGAQAHAISRTVSKPRAPHAASPQTQADRRRFSAIARRRYRACVNFQR